MSGTDTAEEPFGSGSIRVAATANAPDGYPVKANQELMRYLVPESPAYPQAVAEVWFCDVETAERGGFSRLDSKGDEPPGAAVRGSLYGWYFGEIEGHYPSKDK